MPLPLSGRGYLQLLPVCWCAITGRGIHRGDVRQELGVHLAADGAQFA
ncbi:hypothetical protein [Streptomyces sp. Ncost-T10-10d]|nr:hypothetical protein [Streptomyces sp. Ncost-T10-10d]